MYFVVSGAVGLLLISSGVTMAVPFCMGRVIDIIYTAAEQGQLLEKLNIVCQILVVVFVVGGVANFGRVYLMQVAGQRIIRQLREKLFGSVIKQEMGFFDKTRTGELINRLSTDTSLVGQSVTMNVSDGLRAVAQAIGGVGMMVSVVLALCMMVSVWCWLFVWCKYGVGYLYDGKCVMLAVCMMVSVVMAVCMMVSMMLAVCMMVSVVLAVRMMVGVWCLLFVWW